MTPPPAGEVHTIGYAFRDHGGVFVGFLLALGLQNGVSSAQRSFDTDGLTFRTSILFVVLVVLCLYTFLVGQFNLSRALKYGPATWLGNFLLYVFQAIALAFMGSAVSDAGPSSIGFTTYLVAYYLIDAAWAIYTIVAKPTILKLKPALLLASVTLLATLLFVLAALDVWTIETRIGMSVLLAIVAVHVVVAAAFVLDLIRRDEARSATSGWVS
ncbi:MAG: hypothetical protein QOE93_2112 [Actinomycetota bacterium]|jgi:hypothetical protein|nr:hypothetical protein [Actinomycetota bacterium]